MATNKGVIFLAALPPNIDSLHQVRHSQKLKKYNPKNIKIHKMCNPVCYDNDRFSHM